MTIFAHEENWKKVLAGVKDHTRRRKKKSDRTVYENGGVLVSLYRNDHLLYDVGRTYAIVPKRNEKSVGRFKLLRLWEESDVRMISFSDAIREGYRCPVDFLRAWLELNDPESPVRLDHLKFGIADVQQCYLANLQFWEAITARPAHLYQAYGMEIRVTEKYLPESVYAR